MLGHEDVDLFTFLPAQNVEGLQIYNRENGKWIRLNAPRGTIILNTGDYMQRITNDRLPSTTHRVALPVDRSSHGKPRISMPMNISTWETRSWRSFPASERRDMNRCPQFSFTRASQANITVTITP